MPRPTMPKTPITLKEGLRIDFRTEDGKPLNYLRFEITENDGVPTFVGAIDDIEKMKLKKLKSAIDYLLQNSKVREN